jgi:hypothetical protein
MEARCPKCLEWYPVEWETFSYWWRDSAGCPGCGAIVLVESECDFRKGETMDAKEILLDLCTAIERLQRQAADDGEPVDQGELQALVERARTDVRGDS